MVIYHMEMNMLDAHVLLRTYPHLVDPSEPKGIRVFFLRPSKSISMKKNKDTTRLEIPNFASPVAEG